MAGFYFLWSLLLNWSNICFQCAKPVLGIFKDKKMGKICSLGSYRVYKDMDSQYSPFSKVLTERPDLEPNINQYSIY